MIRRRSSASGMAANGYLGYLGYLGALLASFYQVVTCFLPPDPALGRRGSAPPKRVLTGAALLSIWRAVGGMGKGYGHMKIATKGRTP